MLPSDLNILFTHLRPDISRECRLPISYQLFMDAKREFLNAYMAVVPLIRSMAPNDYKQIVRYLIGADERGGQLPYLSGLSHFHMQNTIDLVRRKLHGSHDQLAAAQSSANQQQLDKATASMDILAAQMNRCTLLESVSHGAQEDYTMTYNPYIEWLHAYHRQQEMAALARAELEKRNAEIAIYEEMVQNGELDLFDTGSIPASAWNSDWNEFYDSESAPMSPAR